MTREILLLAILIITLLSIQGYPYFIASSLNNKKLCLTNSSNPVAFIYKLNNNAPTFRQTRLTRLPSNYQKIAFDCDINSVKCGAWTCQNSEVLENLKSNYYNDPFGVIEDSRWNNLEVFRTNGSKKSGKLVNLGPPDKKISIHLSILAGGNVFIAISKHINNFTKLDNGYMIVIDASPNHENSIQKCNNNGKPCDNLKVEESNVLKGGERWIHTTIKINTDINNIELYANTNYILGDSFVGENFTNKDLPDIAMFFSSKGTTAFFKLHEYKYRHLKWNGKMTSPEINWKNSSNICIIVTFGNSKSDAKLIILNIKDDIVHQEPLKSDEWETRKIKWMLDKGYYRFVVEGGPIDIGGINFCNPEEKEGDHFFTSTDDAMAISCEVLEKEGKYGPISLKNKSKSIAPIFNNKEDIDFICGSFGYKDCSKVYACGLDGCFCMSNHEFVNNTCQKECSKGKFGLGCVKKIGECINGNSYDTLTGECIKGCKSGYRKPFCKTRLLNFDSTPQIVNTSAYAVTISLKDALLEMTSSASSKKKQSDQFWKARQVLIQISVIDYSKDRNKIAEMFKLEEPHAILKMYDLRPNTDYMVNAIIVEEGQQMGKPSPDRTFSTPKCTKIDQRNTLLSVLNERLEISRSVDEDQGCRIISYGVNITSSNKTIFYKNVPQNSTTTALELPEFLDFIEYDIFIYAEDNSCSILKYTADIFFHQHYILVILIAVISGTILILACVCVACRKQCKSKNIRTPSVHYYADVGNFTLDNNPPVQEVNRSLPPSVPKNTSIGVSKLLAYMESSSSSELLKKLHETIPRGQTKSWQTGETETNMDKNRYKNTLAYDSTRVVLKNPEAWDFNNMSDYINANYIDGYNKTRAYIATQGPLANTTVDFWWMIWQEKVNLIVMVTNLIENGKKKCDKYWPDYPSTIQFGNICVTNENEEEFVDHIVRYLCVSDSTRSRSVVQLHYTAWPFNKVPTHALSVANFCKKVQKAAQGEAPITVHCSAGVGRTGTIILIDACLQMAAAEGSVDPRGLLAAMRAQRLNMVDNEIQFEFVHWVLVEMLTVPQFSIPDCDFLGEYAKLTAKKKLKLSKQYRTLSRLCESDWRKVEKSNLSGISSENCRFAENLADPGCIVQIFGKDGETLTPVNAIYMSSCVRNNHYIVTETPLPNTVHLFWQMIAQFQIDRVIVLNEPGPSEGLFLPSKEDNVRFDNLSVVVLKSKLKMPNYKINTYQTFLNGEEGKPVNFIRISGWEVGVECGIPVNMLIQIWEDTDLMKSGEVTLVVCHDGLTASGLFLATGFVLEQIKIEKRVDVATVVRTLRQIRPKYITGQSQYEFLHRVAHDYLHARDSETYDVIF